MDDGSPDNSGAICNEYAAKDTRFKVIHKENGGVSSARQTGLNVVSGDYVIHVDPDDWVDKDMLAELYAKAIAEDADMVICDYYAESKSGCTYLKQEPSDTNHEVVLRELYSHLHGSCCNKLVRLACIESYNIRFPEGVNLCEDLYFNTELLQHPIKVVYLPEAFYHYDLNMNKNSMVRKPSVSSVESLKRFTNHFESLWLRLGMENTFNKYKFWTIKNACYSNSFTPEQIWQFFPNAEKDFRTAAFKHWYSTPENMFVYLRLRNMSLLARLYFSAILRIKKLINK